MVDPAERSWVMAGIAFRYVGREWLVVFAGLLGLLLAVGLGGRFIGFLQEAATGRFTAEALWLLVAFRVPEFVQVTVPFALYLALLLTLGRLHAEQEHVVLVAGGVRPRRILLWLLASAAPVAAAVAVLSFVVTPEARRLYADLSLEQLVDSELDAVIPGAFHVYAEGRRTTYARAVDRDANRLEGVFMAERDGPVSVTVWADAAQQHRVSESGRFLELKDGRRYEGVPGESPYRVVEFARLSQRIDRTPPVPLDDARRTATAELALDDPRQAAEWQWRAAFPVMCLVSVVLAVGIAKPAPRAGRFSRLLPAVALFVVYYLSLVFARDFVADGLLGTVPGLWPAHLILLGTGVWLLGRGP